MIAYIMFYNEVVFNRIYSITVVIEFDTAWYYIAILASSLSAYQIAKIRY